MPRVGTMAVTWMMAVMMAVGAVLAALLLAIPAFHMPSAGLDPSWQSALEYAYLNGLVLGRDFNFTSGPLSFVYTRQFHPDTFVWVIGATLHATAVYAAAAWSGAMRVRGAVLLVWLALCCAPLDPDALFLSLPLIVFFLSLARSVPGWVLAVLIAGLALSSLAKFSVLVTCLPLLALADLTAALTGGRGGWRTATYGLALLVLYTASGQPPDAIPQFLIGAFDVAIGYGQAMANFGWESQQTLLAIAALAILASAFVVLRGAPFLLRTSCLLSLAGFLLIAFKLGNVRVGHQTATWNAFAVAGFAIILLPWKAERISTALAVGCVFMCAALSLHFIGRYGPIDAIRVRATMLGTAASSAAEWLDPVAHVARLSERRKAAQRQLASRVPRDLSGTVGSVPWELSEIVAAGLHLVPAPSLQTYSNYTPRLRELTRKHFSQAGAPEHLFFQLVAIDNRYRTTELGPALIPIIAGYDVVRRYSTLRGAPMQLHRRAKPRSTTLLPLVEKTASMGQWVDAPRPAQGGLLIAIRPAETIFGRILTFLYKQSAFEMDLRFADGATVTARIVPNLASDGSLIIPPGLADVELFREAENGFAIDRRNPLQALRIRTGSLGSLRYATDYTLVASAVTMEGEPERELLPQDPARTAMQALIEGRILESPDVRVVDEQLLAHAPSKIVASMPTGGRLTGELGFFNGAWLQGRPKPVSFAISLMTATGPRLLFEKTLDPRNRPADRGSQRFSVDIPDGAIDQPVELLFETGPETPWGWTYWSGLAIVR